MLGTYSRPDLEINIDSCKFMSAGTIALAEALACNQGPTSLTWYNNDYCLAPVPSGASVNAAPVASYHATTSLSAENVAAPTSGQNRKTCP